MLDDDLDKKLRQIQTKMSFESRSSVSFSNVINDVLRQAVNK